MSIIIQKYLIAEMISQNQAFNSHNKINQSSYHAINVIKLSVVSTHQCCNWLRVETDETERPPPKKYV